MAFENMNKTTDAGLSPEIVEFHRKALLKNILPALVNARDMQMVALPANNGRRVQFRKPVPLDVRLDPLGEGVTPAGQKMTMTELWMTINPYGGHMEYTDEIDWALMDRNTLIMRELLADQAKLTLDTLAANARSSGMTVQYAGGKANRAALTAADKLTYSEVKKAVRTLDRNNAKKFADGFYHAIVHPDTVYDLTEDAMWIDVAKYQDKRKVETGELGCMGGVKFFDSTNAKVFNKQTYIGADIASLTITSNSYKAADKSVTVTKTDLTDEQARALIGKLVRVNNEDAVIENVTGNVVKFRWALSDAAVTAINAASSAIKINPTGAGASNATVYSTVIYGQDFAGGVALDGTGDNVSMIIKPLGSSGALDPLNQRGTVGWKVRGVAYGVIQDLFGVRIEHGATA